MIKNLKKRMKNKKGFTLVELIVVIVIILVLSAVMVPSVLRYIEKANQANCKADAATILVQLQADVAEKLSETASYEKVSIGGYTYVADKATEDPGAKNYSYTMNNAADSPNYGDITEFSFGNAKYYITWTKETGWDAVHKR